MTIIISYGYLVDDLETLPVFRVIYKQVEYGFQSTPEGNNAVNKIIAGASSIEELFSEEITHSNAGAVLTRISKEKYGVLAHNKSDALKAVIGKLPSYRAKLQKRAAQIRLGRSPSDLPSDIYFDTLFLNSRLDEKVKILVDSCEFISLWPKYWGEYGEHFFIAKNFPEKIKDYLENLFYPELLIEYEMVSQVGRVKPER